MSCTLRVVGEYFDIDKFLIGSSLTACAVFRKGELKRRNKPKGELITKNSMNISVSDAEFHDLKASISDAIIYLKTNNTELKRLMNFTGIEGACFDFGIEKRDIVAQFNAFPAELLLLMGSLGIDLEISQYPVSESKDDFNNNK